MVCRLAGSSHCRRYNAYIALYGKDNVAVGNSRGRFLSHIACCLRRAAYIGHYNMRPFGGTAYFPP